ncbi:MAG: Energy-coupling factor transporter transmembrane protein EcfT [Methanocella sp. PtaU1.Bin125]|nr:MAG: Energy-coupling factor transporter transmembrane protein EcfT [Methanocella sp. PtaU1.Bin125]
MTIPAWMSKVDSAPCEYRVARGGRKNFVRKSIDGVVRFFGESMASESYANRPGLLQGLDPRIKLVSILAIVISVSLTRDIKVLAVVYALVLLFALLSRIGPLFFIKRVWLFIPLFTGVIAFPIIFNIFTPGDSLVVLAAPGPGVRLGPLALPDTISITGQGVMTASVFTLRVATSVSAVVLLFLTTRQDMLFKSFRAIGMPKVYVLVMDMCYRYIFIFMEVIRDLYTAKKSRTIRNQSLADDWKWVGSRIGYTLVKTLDMSEKVHRAMMSRGFTGDVKLMNDFQARKRDYVALSATLAFSLALVLISQNIIKV